jgi:hypothetical protein
VGTSSDHPGGSGKAWNKARTSGREWASSGGGSGPGLIGLVANAAAALAGYEGAAATRAAAPGVTRIGGLASGPPDQTLNDALRRNGLDDLIGRPPQEVHAALVDFIAGDPEDRDADLVRQAADEAVAELLETADDLEAIVVDEAAGERMMLRFLTEWLTRLITRELGTALLDQNAREAEQRSAEIREYIAERLAALIERTPIADIDWNNTESNTEARRILDGAREVFDE